MKSALELVAFAHATDTEGAVALLETALEALDRAGQHMSAALVDLALNRLHEQRVGLQTFARLNS